MYVCVCVCVCIGPFSGEKRLPCHHATITLICTRHHLEDVGIQDVVFRQAVSRVQACSIGLVAVCERPILAACLQWCMYAPVYVNILIFPLHFQVLRLIDANATNLQVGLDFLVNLGAFGFDLEVRHAARIATRTCNE